MESWTWTEVLLYLFCTFVQLLRHCSILNLMLLSWKFTRFLALELPISVIWEFRFFSFNRRNAARCHDSFFELVALSYARFILKTFQAEFAERVFFSEFAAKMLFKFRRMKYGTNNIGDFNYKSVESDGFKGYWVSSKCRKDQPPDLAIYFVPGNMFGFCSSYNYVEFVAMVMVSLQLVGFGNPVALVADVKYLGRANYLKNLDEVARGYKYFLNEIPENAITVFLGSGVGCTFELSMLLEMAKPMLPRQIELHRASATPSMCTESSNTTSCYTTSASCVSSTTHCSTRSASSPPDGSVCSCDFTTAASRPDEEEDIHDLRKYLTKIHRSNASFDESGSSSSQSESQSSGSESSKSDNCPPLSEQDQPSIFSQLRKPHAMILMSPVAKMNGRRSHVYPDVVSTQTLAQLRTRMTGDSKTSPVWANPYLITDGEWWHKAMPDFGTTVLYGSAETLTSEINELMGSISNCTKLRTFGQICGNQLHAWPIASTYIGRTTSEQMIGIGGITGEISKMVLMECMCQHPPA